MSIEVMEAYKDWSGFIFLQKLKSLTWFAIVCMLPYKYDLFTCIFTSPAGYIGITLSVVYLFYLPINCKAIFLWKFTVKDIV